MHQKVKRACMLRAEAAGCLGQGVCWCCEKGMCVSGGIISAALRCEPVLGDIGLPHVQEGLAAAADTHHPLPERRSQPQLVGQPSARGLRALSLAGCNLSCYGLQRLCRACAKTLEQLDLSRTGIFGLPSTLGWVRAHHLSCSLLGTKVLLSAPPNTIACALVQARHLMAMSVACLATCCSPAVRKVHYYHGYAPTGCPAVACCQPVPEALQRHSAAAQGGPSAHPQPFRSSPLPDTTPLWGVPGRKMRDMLHSRSQSLTSLNQVQEDLHFSGQQGRRLLSLPASVG